LIARVFPRKTNASPTDALAFFREPTIGKTIFLTSEEPKKALQEMEGKEDG
jgi:hypothetical protein